MPSSSISLRCVARIAGIARVMKRLWAAMTWSGPRRESFILLFIGWPALCLHYHTLLVYLFPLAFFINSPYSENTDRRLEQARETLNWIESLVYCRDGMSSNGLLVLVTLWYGLNLLYRTHQIVLVVGILGIAGASPWVRNRWPAVLFRSLWVVLHGTRQQNQDDHAVSLTQHLEDFQKHHMQANTTIANFEFVLYENQRSWPLAGWTSQTFALVDRAVWTDTAKKPSLPKNQFELPETINVGERTWVWVWVDNDWRVDLQDMTDELGWQYGTPFWSLFDLTPKGWISTRRRRWIRTASLRSSPGQRMALVSPTSFRPSPPSPIVQSMHHSTPNPTHTPTSPVYTPPTSSPSPLSPTPSVSSKRIISLASSAPPSPPNASNISLNPTNELSASTATLRKPGNRESSGISWKSIARVTRHKDRSSHN